LMAQNLALAIGMMSTQGISGLSEIASIDGFVPGRLEKVSSSPDVYLDYAHTPEAIALALRELKTKYSRVSALIGFSGERDHSKRKPMIEFASLADRVIATTQHPRSEGPEQILADIKRHKPDMAVADEPIDGLRQLAQGMTADECLVWFGPGNLEYREFADGKKPFYPRQVIAEVVSDQP
jgi:UDP-N-acetylmuramoyl-L-alanyl-D-glutamate--2,6-diaminopimelate ligase